MKQIKAMIQAADQIWLKYNDHPFVKAIEDGTLERDKFRHYMVQDYLYLLEYAKVFALGVAKAKTLQTAQVFAKYIRIMTGEMKVHEGYAGLLQITEEELETTPRALDNLSYTSYMLRVAYEEGEAEILAAILACSYSYELIAKRIIANNPQATEHEFYGNWIRSYSSKEYEQSNIQLLQLLAKLTAHYSEAQFQHLEEILIACSRYEMAFWDFSWEQRF